MSAPSGEASATVLADSMSPTVAVTSPLDGATVSGVVVVSADGSDDVGVLGVQFLLDGTNLGAEDTTPPYSVSWLTTSAANVAVPNNLTATGTIGAATLSWIASSDNMGVTNYNVHRSLTSGFTPSSSNRVAQPTSTTFTDSGLTAGVYFYLLTAEDGAGNVSAPSGEASATVLADSTSPTVAVTSPLDAATVSGVVVVSADGSDDVGASLTI